MLLVLGLFGWILYGAPFDGLVLRQIFDLPASDLSGAQRMESWIRRPPGITSCGCAMA